jgi:hypothetical protein
MFFALAFIAALNPKLLALDLLLIENRRPRAMFACILAGGIATGVTIGLIDVLAVHADAVKSQGKASAGVDLGLGLVLLVIGGALMTGLLARVWAQRPQSDKRAAKKEAKKQKTPGDSRMQRALREPRLGLAVLIGALCGLPGAAYLSALHNLIAGKHSTATQVVAVFVFVIIEFLLIIIPWLLLELRPAATANNLRRAQAWLSGHVTALVAWILILLGVYLTVSGLVHLL